MKSLRSVVMGFALIGLIAFLSGVSFAQDTQTAGKQRHEAKIMLLQSSAAALQKSSPDLAKGLTDLANAQIKEKSEWQAKHEAKVKLLKDAAAALAQSNPDLAKGLLEMTQACQEKNEKEEVGEKVEPKQEQGETK